MFCLFVVRKERRKSLHNLKGGFGVRMRNISLFIHFSFHRSGSWDWDGVHEFKKKPKAKHD